MASTILPSPTLSSATTFNATPGIKLAPLIRHANVVSYERRQGKMWFIIHVDPQQFNNIPSYLKRHPYTIARKYDDCVQFCQRLYDAFPCLNNPHQRSRQQNNNIYYDLPKLKPQGILNKKQPNGQKRAELDRFVQALFRLPPSITQSLIVLEFFGLQKGDTEQQVLRDKQNYIRQQQAIINSTTSYSDYSFFEDPYDNNINGYSLEPSLSTTSKWSFKSLRGRSASSNSLSSFCSQAAQRLPWTSTSSSSTSNMRKKSSNSLLNQYYEYDYLNQYPTSPMSIPSSANIPGLISCSSSTTSNNSVSSVNETRRNTSPSTTSIRMIKLKVIYDVDNIVVIQIPRSTSLSALRTRLHDKFSTMLDPSLKPLADQFVLLYNESARTSSTSTVSNDDQHPLPTTSAILGSSSSITLISKEAHWAKAMKSWDSLEKITLRCIH
ncbi:unnamed protein product [Cunninghamella blakesleeana]